MLGWLPVVAPPGPVILFLTAGLDWPSTTLSPTYFLQVSCNIGAETAGKYSHLRLSSVSLRAVFLAASCPSKWFLRSDSTTAIL